MSGAQQVDMPMREMESFPTLSDQDLEQVNGGLAFLGTALSSILPAVMGGMGKKNKGGREEVAGAQSAAAPPKNPIAENAQAGMDPRQDQRWRQQVAQGDDGICPDCGGGYSVA